MMQQDPRDLTLLLGSTCAHHSGQHQLTCVTLWPPQPGKSVPALWTPGSYLPLSPVGSLPWTTHPGVKPIGVGETVRRIVGKQLPPPSVMTFKPLPALSRCVQGIRHVCEAAVYAMCQVSKASDTDAIILVDTSNAFNMLNRQTALRNIHQLCPALYKALISTYREDVQLFINEEALLSQEGTTQRDPLAMAIYLIAITPLIH